jgi:hypothetical protein
VQPARNGDFVTRRTSAGSMRTVRAGFSAMVMLLVGCQGESVTTPSGDSGIAADSAVADTAVADAAVETSSDAGCIPAGNLIPPGDFAKASGAWAPEPWCSIEVVDVGPCGGKALRIYNLTKECSVKASFSSLPIPNGTNLRLRAKYKKGTGDTPGYQPRVILRSYGPGGMGEFDETSMFGTVGAEWVEKDLPVTIKREQTGMEVILYVFLDPGTTPPREYLIADVSLVKE